MAENTITAILPDVYEALDVVSRELTGLIPAVFLSTSAKRAELNQNIVVDVEPAYAAGVTISPAMTVPEPTGETSGSVTINISNSKAYEFGFNGEDEKGLQTGPGYMGVRASKIAQRIRTLVNDVEADLAGLQSTFSRAYGTAGTTPFATAGDLTDAANALKILKDNGAPPSDNHLIMDTTAGAKFIGLQNRYDMSGDRGVQQQGVLRDITGMSLRESAQIVTGGSNVITGTVTVTGANAIGTTTVNVTTAAGAGVTASAGDIVTFAGDSNKYVLAAAVTIGASTTGNLTLAAPGLRVATSGSEAVAGVAAATRNMAFARSALVLAARPPARPEEGDLASDVMLVTDPRSGLTFELAMYKGYRKVRYEIALAWGVKNIKPEHTALLLG